MNIVNLAKHNDDAKKTKEHDGKSVILEGTITLKPQRHN